MDAKDFDLLYRSLDGPLTEDEERRLRLLLAVSPEARLERQRLQALRTALYTHTARSFEPDFANRVMARVAEEDAAARAPALPQGPSLIDRLGWWLREFGLSRRVVGWSIAITALIVVAGVSLWLRPSVVEVPYGQTAAVSLPDGTNVELASGTTLAYRWRWGQEERRVRLDGEAFFEVTPGERPFIVEAPNATVTVTGTRFNVATWPVADQPQTVVTVEEGRVEVAARRPAPEAVDERDTFALPAARMRAVAPVVTLEAGQRTWVVAQALAPQPPQRVNLDDALIWRVGGLWFKDQRLDVIFRQLERRYAVQIEAASPEVAARHHTYHNPSPMNVAAVLADICRALDLRFRRTADGYEVFAP